MKKLAIAVLLFFSLSNVQALDINSKSIILYNLNDDVVVSDIKKDEQISVASMTKIMTVLVALENIDDLDKKVVITEEVFDNLTISNASVAGFKIDEVVTYRDLLYGTFLPSGADAANALAINISGNVNNFVKVMNEKAKELNLINTNFVNVTGLDDINHYSSVKDIAILLKYALKDNTFKEIFLTKKYVTTDLSKTFYSNLSKSLEYYKIDADYIIGGKTGFTLNAGRCLASVAYDSVNDIYYLLVTAGASIDDGNSHLLDAKNIYEYYFNNYGYHNVVGIGDTLFKINLKYINSDIMSIKSKKNITKYISNSFDKSDIKYKYNGTSDIDVIYEDNIVGKLNIINDTNLHILSLNISIRYIIIIITVVIIFIIYKLTKKRTIYKQ